MTAYELYHGHDGRDDVEKGRRRYDDGDSQGDFLLNMPEEINDTSEEQEEGGLKKQGYRRNHGIHTQVNATCSG